MHRHTTILTMCTAMLACAACAPARTSQPTWQAAGAAETQQISVLVENLTRNDVVVYSRVPGSYRPSRDGCDRQHKPLPHSTAPSVLP